MDSLRLILLIAGVLLIVGIYAWDRLRRGRLERARARDIGRPRAADRGNTPARDHEILDDVLLADTAQIDAEPFDLGLDEVAGARRERALDDTALVDFASHAREEDFPRVDDDDLDAFADEIGTGHDTVLDKVETQAAASDTSAKQESRETVTDDEAEQIADKLDEGLIQIWVTARRGQRFLGGDLLAAARAAGLEHGAMRIFHGKAEGGGVFSMANLVEPGWFDPRVMDQSFTTPGVCLFMPLAGGGDPVRTFDAMLMAAGTLARHLDAELRDETRSILSRQTATHLREQVTQYRLRKRVEQRATTRNESGRRR